MYVTFEGLRKERTRLIRALYSLGIAGLNDEIVIMSLPNWSIVLREGGEYKPLRPGNVFNEVSTGFTPAEQDNHELEEKIRPLLDSMADIAEILQTSEIEVSGETDLRNIFRAAAHLDKIVEERNS